MCEIINKENADESSERTRAPRPFHTHRQELVENEQIGVTQSYYNLHDGGGESI